MAKATYAKNFRSFRAFRGQINSLRLSVFAFSKIEVLPPMILLCTSYDPIVPERTWNGFTTDL